MCLENYKGSYGCVPIVPKKRIICDMSIAISIKKRGSRMDRMKTFFKYILAIVLLFVFSNFIINALLKNSYTKIKDYKIEVSEVYVDVTEAKASKWGRKYKRNCKK